MTKRFIPIAAPILTGNEKAYVLDCIESSWISSCGKYVERFERTFADFCGVRYAVSCSSGTAALHVALLALGVGPGDEVIVPTLTFVATANAVTYCGARPRFVDIEPDTWTLDPRLVEAKINAHKADPRCNVWPRATWTTNGERAGKPFVVRTPRSARRGIRGRVGLQ